MSSKPNVWRPEGGSVIEGRIEAIDEHWASKKIGSAGHHGMISLKCEPDEVWLIPHSQYNYQICRSAIEHGDTVRVIYGGSGEYVIVPGRKVR